MMSRLCPVRITPASTTTATTTPWPLPALPGALRLHALPRFGLKALYRNPRHSTVKNGTCLKIMVSPVRVRVPPLLFSRHLQEDSSASFARRHIEHGIHHNCHLLEMLREEVVESQSGLTVHSGGD